MKIAIHKGDGAKARFPNLALMKLSAYHKYMGHEVSWFDPLFNYDKIYSSKVFTFTKQDPYLPETAVRGGTGYGLMDTLPFEVDCVYPDYSIYPDFKHAIGFITRGCIRNCEFCIVPEKEGRIRRDRDFEDILFDRNSFSNRKSAVLMDNNFLAYRKHEEQLEKIIRSGARIDFNQGLDCRLISDDNAKLLAKVKWIRFIRFSCDSRETLSALRLAVSRIRSFGYTGQFFCYVLVRDIENALDTVESLRRIQVDPFAQAFIDFSGTDKRTQDQKSFCRWVNRKAIFKTVQWKHYKNKENSK